MNFLIEIFSKFKTDVLNPFIKEIYTYKSIKSS